MVSNFGFGRQQVPCYLSEFMALKCYFCHVFVMCSFHTEDVDNMDNILKHEREMEIGEPTSKTLKRLRQEQQQEP